MEGGGGIAKSTRHGCNQQLENDTEYKAINYITPGSWELIWRWEVYDESLEREHTLSG